MMMISFVFGLVLAQRFRVLVLFPAIALALIFTVGTEVARAEAAWTIVQSATAAVIGLQLGYLAGIVARHLVLTRLLVTRQPVSWREHLPALFPDQASYPSKSPKHADLERVQVYPKAGAACEGLIEDAVEDRLVQLRELRQQPLSRIGSHATGNRLQSERGGAR